jgi:predicted N-acetyltransferase YhbS
LDEVIAGALSAPEPLRSDHQIDAFNSGVPALDQWLKRRGLANEVAGATRTFVTCQDSRVVGYYSLAAASVVHSIATSRVRRNMPDPAPAVVLARLAVDKRMQGVGLGADLLQDAALRVLAAADSIGVRALLVHDLSDNAKRFYLRYGFRESPIEPMTLMITVDELKRDAAGLSM